MPACSAVRLTGPPGLVLGRRVRDRDNDSSGRIVDPTVSARAPTETSRAPRMNHRRSPPTWRLLAASSPDATSSGASKGAQCRPDHGQLDRDVDDERINGHPGKREVDLGEADSEDVPTGSVGDAGEEQERDARGARRDVDALGDPVGPGRVGRQHEERQRVLLEMADDPGEEADAEGGAEPDAQPGRDARAVQRGPEVLREGWLPHDHDGRTWRRRATARALTAG